MDQTTAQIMRHNEMQAKPLLKLYIQEVRDAEETKEMTGLQTAC